MGAFGRPTVYHLAGIYVLAGVVIVSYAFEPKLSDAARWFAGISGVFLAAFGALAIIDRVRGLSGIAVTRRAYFVARSNLCLVGIWPPLCVMILSPGFTAWDTSWVVVAVGVAGLLISSALAVVFWRQMQRSQVANPPPPLG